MMAVFLPKLVDCFSQLLLWHPLTFTYQTRFEGVQTLVWFCTGTVLQVCLNRIVEGVQIWTWWWPFVLTYEIDILLTELTLGSFWSMCRGRVLLVRTRIVLKELLPACATPKAAPKLALSTSGSLFRPLWDKDQVCPLGSSTFPPNHQRERFLDSINVPNGIWDVLTTSSKYTVVLTITCLFYCEQPHPKRESGFPSQDRIGFLAVYIFLVA